jgi:hypothetical protein
MAQQASAAFVEQFGANVEQLVQQGDTRFRNRVRNESQKSKTEYFEQMGATAAVAVTSRFPDSPHIDPDHQRRAVYLTDYHWGQLYDSFDKVKLLIDPLSAGVQAASMAMNRALDDVVIAAATGSAYADTGSGNGTVSAVAIGSGQQIIVNYAAVACTTNVGLTLAKLIKAKSILGKNEIPAGSILYFAHRQQQLDDLLNNVSQVQSSDYAAVKALVQGEVNYFMGFEFFRSERLANNTTSDVTKCIAYEKMGLLLSIGMDIEKNIAQRADKSFNWYAYYRMSLGATRMQEKKVVEVSCDESP